MANYNIQISLTKLPEAEVMNVEKNGKIRKCVVIPINNEEGVIQDEYEAKNPDGSLTVKSLNDVRLNLSAFEFREQKYGHTHGVKVSYNGKTLEHMSEDRLRHTPFLGSLTPWALTGAVPRNGRR